MDITTQTKNKTTHVGLLVVHHYDINYKYHHHTGFLLNYFLPELQAITEKSALMNVMLPEKSVFLCHEFFPFQ